MSLPDLAPWWWGRTPAALSRISPSLALSLSDGIHVAAWPSVADLGPPACFALGLLAGWTHPGFDVLWSQSLLFMALVAAVGTLSAALGAYLVAGFAVGDWVFARHQPAFMPDPAPHVFAIHNATLQFRLPLIVGYALLALLAVRIPMTAKALTAQLPLRQAWSRRARLAVALLGHAVATLAMVAFWVQATPVLIRPIFTWAGDLAPPTDVITPLQQHGSVVVLAAVVASAVRMIHQFPLAFDPAIQSRFDRLQAPLLSDDRLRVPPSPRRRWASAIARGAFTTLVAVGIFANAVEAVVMFVASTLLYLALAGVVHIPLGGWARLVGRVPILIRLVVGVVVIRGVATLVLNHAAALGGPSDLFRPFVLGTLFTLVVLYLLAAPGRQPTPAKASP